MKMISHIKIFVENLLVYMKEDNAINDSIVGKSFLGIPYHSCNDMLLCK